MQLIKLLATGQLCFSLTLCVDCELCFDVTYLTVDLHLWLMVTVINIWLYCCHRCCNIHFVY